jgi:hypothetical protein
MATEVAWRHLSNPSLTLTVPNAHKDLPNHSVTARPWPTANVPTLLVVPEGVDTEITPAEAPTGTDVVMRVSESTVNELGTSLNETPVAPLKPEPTIET